MNIRRICDKNIKACKKVERMKLIAKGMLPNDDRITEAKRHENLDRTINGNSYNDTISTNCHQEQSLINGGTTNRIIYKRDELLKLKDDNITLPRKIKKYQNCIK